ncbi:hypothetical protein GUJ93_ZPchr0013g36074 [Zizania palustris]|uniref:Uncharacterized protein n=1 Tax=Zizania palustris TaxID=103762 RepID=A0A8J5WT82_ZIZPA|nr:hypothetical protein GUJ93_ZPchr0013g36074 [Zizania palustris]
MGRVLECSDAGYAVGCDLDGRPEAAAASWQAWESGVGTVFQRSPEGSRDRRLLGATGVDWSKRGLWAMACWPTGRVEGLMPNHRF